MKAINLQNIGIIAGAIAVGYLVMRVAKTKAAMQSLGGDSQYGNSWTDDQKTYKPNTENYEFGDFVNNKKDLTYV